MITADELRSRKFDWHKFLNMPKCVGAWSRGESGCLLTAFWHALGYDLNAAILDGLRLTTDLLAWDSLGQTPFPIAYNHIPATTAISFTASIINNYDHGRPEIALELLFQLIEAVWGSEGKPENATESVAKQVCKI